MPRLLVWVMGVIMGTGCTDSKTAANGATSVTLPSASAAPSASAPVAPAGLLGGWSLHVETSNPSINPDLFPTPEARLRVFLDHDARVVDGKVEVTVAGLDRKGAMKDEGQALELEGLVTKTNWATVKARADAEKASEGATVFVFEIANVGEPLRIVTTSLASYPELKAIHDIVQAATPK